MFSIDFKYTENLVIIFLLCRKAIFDILLSPGPAFYINSISGTVLEVLKLFFISFVLKAKSLELVRG